MTSNFTPIPQHERYEISRDGVIRNRKNKKLKAQYIGSTGYYMVSFSYFNKSKPQRVHRLLAKTFIPNPNNLPEINHKNGNKLDYSLENLEWVNRTENVRHAFKTGLANNTGSNNGMCKLDEESVKIIKRMLQDGISQTKIAFKLNHKVTRSAISAISTGRLWRHISPGEAF
jgi:hypothetical protein